MRALTIASVALWTGIAQGKATIRYTTEFPGNEVIYGCLVTYHVENLSGQVRSIWWDFRSTGACESTFRAMPGKNEANTRTNRADVPGTFEVKCTIKYYPNRATHRIIPDDVPMLTITVPPPDGVKILMGDRQSVPIGAFNTTYFLLTCKNKDTCSATGVVQERLVNVRNSVGKVTDPDSGWLVPVPDPRFYLDNNVIVDKKIARGGRGFPKDHVLFSAEQRLRVVIPDFCGRDVPYELPSFHIRYIKGEGDTYHIDHDPVKQP